MRRSTTQTVALSNACAVPAFSAVVRALGMGTWRLTKRLLFGQGMSGETEETVMRHVAFLPALLMPNTASSAAKVMVFPELEAIIIS